jgi:outer membrane immunogenic protein
MLGGIAVVTWMAAVPSFAADLPSYGGPAEPYYSPVPVFRWSGYYVGANGGYGFGSFTGGGATRFGSAEAGLFGLTAGYNYQIDHFVVGVEGDVDWADLKSEKTYAHGAINETAETDGLWSFRGRVGYAMDNVLLYVTGGYIGGMLKTSLYDATVPVPTGGPTYKSNNFNSGYVIGVGLEYAFNNSISVKTEYLYRSLGDQPVFGGAHLTRAGLNESVVRGGINYHF